MKLDLKNISRVSILILSLGFGEIYGQEEVKINIEDSQELNYKFTYNEGVKYKLLGNYKLAYQLFQKCIEIDKNRDGAYYELANLALMNKEIDNSVKFGKKALELNPENEWYYVQLGQSYLYANKIDSSIFVYKQLTEKFPKKLEYKFNLAALLKESKNLKAAVKEIDRILKKEGFTANLVIEKFNILVELKEYKKAEKEIKKVIKKYPTDIRFLGILAEFYADRKRKDKAEEMYQRMFKVDPENSLVWVSYADFYRRDNQEEKAYKILFEVFAKKEMDAKPKLQMIMSLVNNQEEYKKHKKEIIGLISTLRFAHPKNYEVQSLYAEFLLKENKEKEALDQFRLLYEMDKSNYIIAERLILLENSKGSNDSLFVLTEECIKTFPKESLPYLFNALVLIQDEKYEETLPVLKKGLELVGTNAQLKIQYFNFLGDAYHNLKDHYHSDLYFEKLLTIDPNNVLVLNNYAYYLSVRNEHLDKAERMSKKTIEIEPANGTYLDTYAWILFQMTRYEEALKYIEKAYVNGGEKSAEINDHFGDILFKNDKKEMALSYWKKAKELGKEDEKLEKKIETGLLD